MRSKNKNKKKHDFNLYFITMKDFFNWNDFWFRLWL